MVKEGRRVRCGSNVNKLKYGGRVDKRKLE